MKNIELFDIYASYIFDKLYKNFPTCVDFEPYKEVPSIPSVADMSEDEKIKLFSSTILWLERNGFISVSMSDPSNRSPSLPMLYRSFMCVELTIDGLKLLRQPLPETIEQKNSIGEAIFKKIQEGAFSEAGKLATRAILSYGVQKIKENL